MSREYGENEYLVRWVPGEITDSKRPSIYLFRKGDVTTKYVYSTRGRVYKKLKAVLDLMTPISEGYRATKDYILTKDEFESITGKRP